ncbi:hypothetical protein BDZ89DRAFT_1077081 [Hymenopellis radicata]|nr:hypothetical protein BDZ89DRAFT_1077081 [Hymenopellis radicata]
MLSLRLLILFIAALLCASAPIHVNGTDAITSRGESTKSDFVHTWTPSVAITVLNNVVYAKSSNKASDLDNACDEHEYWKDNGASKGFHVLAGAMPTMGEAVVKAAMV